MKYFFPFFFMVSSLIMAQRPDLSEDFNISVGEPYKRVKTLDEYHFQYGSRMLSLKRVNKNFIIERHSLITLNRAPKKGSLAEMGQFIGIEQFKDTVVVFARKKNRLLAQKLLITQPKVSRPFVFVSEEDNINDDFGFSSRYGYDIGDRINAFGIKKSFDGSKFVVLSKVKHKTNEEAGLTNSLNIHVFNEDFSLDWKKTLPLPFNNKELKTEDFMVDASGNFYILGTKFEDVSLLTTLDKNKDDYRSYVLKIGKEDTNWVTSQLDTEKALGESVLFLDTNNEPVVIGFYSEKEAKGYASGILTSKIKDLNQKISVTHHAVPIDTIISYEKRKASQIDKGQRFIDDKEDLEGLKINKVVSNADGSFNVFAEQRYAERNSTYLNGVTNVYYQLYYRNAYAAKVDGTGNLLWFNQLPKNQFSTRGKRAMSFVHQRFGGYHYLLYWDMYRNIYKNVGDFAELLEMKRQEYLFITSFKINEITGEVTKDPIINSLDVEKQRISSFQMDKVLPISDHRLILEAHNGRGKNYLIQIEGGH